MHVQCTISVYMKHQCLGGSGGVPPRKILILGIMSGIFLTSFAAYKID